MLRKAIHFVFMTMAAWTLFPAGFVEAQQKTLAPPEFQGWLPISDEERQMKSPVVEKDAGAEVLLWRVHVVDELLGDNQSFQRAFYHYVRLKIFDEKGKEQAATIDLPYREPGGIEAVDGRTLKADGTVSELDHKSIYKRTLVRAGGLREKAVSFAMPGVEPGAIIEYRWRQTEDDNRFRYVRLRFQREFPVQKVTYFVKPLSSRLVAAEQMFLVPFNCKTTPVHEEPDGYSSTTVENVPAEHREPFAPSAPNVEPWALLFYRPDRSRDPDKYWNGEGKKLYQELKGLLKSDDEIKSAAAEAVGNAKTEDEKTVALVSYLRKKLRSLEDPSVTTAEREAFLEKLPKNRLRTSVEIFKSGIATSYETNVAFAALAMQAGLDARPVLVGDRDELIFNPKLADRYFLDKIAMAIRAGDSWKVVDVGGRWLAPGLLPWREEGMMALITDPKDPMFIQVPTSPPEASLESRTAHLRLSEDGTLEGDVDESYTGHRAEDYRETIGPKSPAQREEWLKDRVMRMFPDADVSAIQLENVEDATHPLAARYHLRAPLFAQVTGKRLFFQPIAFRRSQGSPFTATERRFPVEFPYAWKEIDQVHILLPAGYSLDHGDSPGSVSFGEIGGYKLQMTISNGKPADLFTARELTFGNRGFLYIPVDKYAMLKKIFDEIQIRDSHSLSLKAN
ncbi:MAG TPA: DUF3857 domain-containing protein [Bryobacteraceae bacterium]|nr:DUF3857 domain-containing protein [Bryobacteraceae bacterium]